MTNKSGFTLFSVAWKNTLQNRSRVALTVVAVVLSVAFLTATLVVAESVTGTANDDVLAANAGLSLVVEGAEITEGGGGPGELASSIRADLDPKALAHVASLDGIRAVTPVIAGFTKVVNNGEAVGGGTAIDVGRNWIVDDQLNPFTLDVGVSPAGADEVVIDASLADDGNLEVGASVELITPTGGRTATVVGIATYGQADAAPLQRTTFFDTAVISEATGQTGTAQLRVALTADADATVVGDQIETSVAGSVVTFGPQFIAAEQAAVTSPFSFLSLFLVAFAAAATLAGATIIYNTLTIAINQRRRELALLRAVGVQRRQILLSVLIETSLVAVTATASGIVVGVLGASGLRRLMDIAGLSFIDGPTVVSPATLLIAAVVGIGVTVGSAWSPARSVSKAAPVEALRTAQVEPTSVSRIRVVAGLFVSVLSIGSAVAAALSSNAIFLAGLVLVVPGLVLAGPALVGAAARLSRRVLAKTAGIEGEIAATNLSRNPRRSASTSLGLTLGVALVVFFSVIASSLTASFQTTLSDQLASNLVVTSVSADFATIDPTLEQRLQDIPGVETAALNAIEGSVAGTGATIGGIGDGIDPFYDFNVSAGDLDDLATGGVAVWSGGDDVIPEIGDEIEIEAPGGSTRQPVVAIFDESLPGFDAPTHLVGSKLATTLAPGIPDWVVFVNARSGPAEELVKAAVADTPGSLFETRESYIGKAGAEIASIRNLIFVLLGLTVLIAVIGIANTTALSVAERVREIGLLRSIGVTRTGIRRIVRLEAGVLALLGSALGVLVGVLGGWALLRTSGGTELTTIAFPWLSLGLTGGCAVLLSIGAAAFPAWRAARLPTLDAIATT